MTLALASRRTALTPPFVRDDLWRKARAVPSLDLRFADNKSLTDAVTGASLVTFTRSSSGTFVDSAGVLRSAVTNLLLRSEEFDTTWSVIGTVTANAITAPNGTVTADLITTNGTSAQLFQGVTISSGATITGSCFLKPNGINETEIVLLSNNNTTPYARATFNISTGVISVAVATANGGTSASANIQAFANGWYRCSVTVTYPAVILAGIRINATGATGGIYLWGVQLEQSSTVGEYIPTTSAINSAPRFDHNPTTGESLGLLVEEQRTNFIRNSTMVGAVAGTPGTLPTNWSLVGGTGLTTQVVGTGTENGITYLDFRFSGTTGNTFTGVLVDVGFSGLETASSYATSFYLKRTAGSLTNLSNAGIYLRYNLTPSGQTDISATVSSLAGPSDALISSRYTAVGTTVGTLSGVGSVFILFNHASGVAVDLTLLIGLPQTEKGAFATSPIPTTTAAATRSADVASITGSAFSGWYRQDEGTMFAAYNQPAFGIPVAAIDDGATSNNSIVLFTSSGANQKASANMLLASANQGRIDAGGTFVPNVLNQAALAVSANGRALSCNGSAVSTSANPSSMPSLSRLGIQGDSNFVSGKGGTIKRLTYWPTCLANSTLQTLTQ